MSIPQEELDKLNDSTAEGLFDEHAEVEEETDEEVEEEQQVEEKVSVSTEEDTVADKARVPYSRFETVNERAIRAEERLAVLEEQLNSNRTESTEEISIPDEWVELYGDSDAAKRAYELQVKSLERMRDESTNRILEDIDKRQTEKQQETERNIEAIDNSLIEFQEEKGIKFTEADESSILDIQDEWTPKDEKGNYIAPLISVEKAYEILTLRQNSAKTDKIIARRKVVSITGSGNEGESSPSDYEAKAWGSWRNKL
jgi:hypothetical protein